MDRTLQHGDPADMGMSPDRLERLGGLCAGWVQQGIMPALQVIVARRGTIVLHGAWGHLGPRPDAPSLANASIFCIGSITKLFTAAAIMSLVEDGLLGLTRPVQEYVPEFVGDGKADVMVHHLLTHTSGMRNADQEAYLRAAISDGRVAAPEPLPYLRDDELLHMRCGDALLDAPLSTAPGVRMSYSNYGYRLLAEIVARVSRKPVERFVQERILDRLGLANTSYTNLPPERLDRVVRRPDNVPWAIMNRPDLVARSFWGFGAAHTTALDLATFTQLFLNGGVYGGRRVLSPVTVAEMTRNQIPGLSGYWAGETFPSVSWAYGWGIQGVKKSPREGSLLSPRSFLQTGIGMHLVWADPVYDLVGVYLSVTPRMATARKGDWCADLFVNAVTASIIE